MYKPSYPGSYYFDTFTFTTMGNSGHRGPLPTQKYANAPWDPDQFSIVDGQQQWTVPANGTYQITAAGAYGAKPGRVVTGQVSLAQNQVLSLLVGQQPTPLTANVVDNVTVGGGGGTFVTSGGKPLMVASGGDGGAYSTGYLPSEFVIPNTIQFSLSMSADGTVMVALNVDANTFQYEYAVYRYSSGVWNFERSFPVVGEGVFLPTISGNGNTILLFSPQNIRVFEYVDSEWTGPYLITDVTPWYTLGARSFSISYDGYTVILSIQSASRGQLVYVCTKNQDLTWNSLIQIQPADVGVNYFRLNSTQVAISGDGTSICVNTEEQLYPYTKKSWVYTRTGESTWGSPVLLSSGSEPFQQIDMSYDGQTIALLLADSNSAMIWLRVYTNGILSKDITLPYFQPNYLAGVIKLSYDGSLLMFAQYFNVTVYTSDSQITVSDIANDLPFTAASMNSTGSLIVNSSISLTNPITYFFEAGGTGQSGSFLPSGTGSGISGAGYLTDGQVSNPYFGFMKPQAYVDGGVGNTYQYGAQGEGGFGGGQSPLNKKTDLTSIIGYKQVRPSIPVNGVRQMNSIALSDDGNTFLASGQRLSGTPLNFTNVYTYTDSAWTNTNISDALAYVSTSANGSIWLIDGDVWRNGSFETTLHTLGSYSSIPGEPRSCISSDGNTAVVLSADYTVSGDIQHALNVYTYSSGAWHAITLPVSPEITNYTYTLQCAISGDGNTIALNLTGAINYPSVFTFVDVYKKVNGTWSTPNRIFTSTSRIDGAPLGINSNGSEIVFSKFLYSNSTITPFPGVENISFSRTNPDFYVYSIGNNIYAPSISLDVTVYINDKNSHVASGSTIVATTDISSPRAFVFVDMYNPTTTCTATTSIAHGYPYNYKVQITGTNSFDGTWDIKVLTSDTFTFQAFGGPDETSGYVSGTTTGISGGGGYTGSPGDGVSGATCYADTSVVNFTDLGAVSNTAGYVTVSLIDPAPIRPSFIINPWSIQSTTFAPATTWSAVAYGNGVYVSVSNNGTFPVMYSTNGLDWLTTTTGAAVAPWKSVTFGEGKFVAGSADGTAMYSIDGIKWVNFYELLYTNSGTGNFGYSMAMSSDGSIIATGSSSGLYVYVHENGVLKYKITGNGGSGNSIAMNADGSVIAIGQAVRGNVVHVYKNGVLTNTYTGSGEEFFFGKSIAMSSDGRVLVITGQYVYVYKDTVLVQTFNDTAVYSVGANFDGSILGISTPDVLKIYDNYVLSYTIPTPDESFYMSFDGSIIATGVSVYTNGVLTKTYTTEGVYLRFSISAMSSDGSVIVITKFYFDENYVFFNLINVYKNEVLTNKIYGENGSAFGKVSTASYDGSLIATGAPEIDLVYVYKFYSFVPYSNWSSVTYGDDKFVAMSSDTDPSSMYSFDGITWIIGNAQIDSWSSVTYGNDKFVSVSGYGTVAYSFDGNMWSDAATGMVSNAWTSVSYGNGQFVAISSNITSIYSLNGVNWVEGGSQGASSNCLAFGDGYFACPSSNSEVSTVSISTNGQSWQQIYLTYTPGLYTGITYGETGFIAVSSTGLLVGLIPTFWVNPTQVTNSSKLNSVNWSDLTYGNGSFVAVGKGLIQTSTDYGNTWASFAVSNTLASVTYSSAIGKFVALPGFFRDGVYTSTDGSAWTLSQTLPDIPSALTSTTYGNGKFVAVMNGSSNVFYSIDGVNWSVGTSSSEPWSSVTYGNGKFVAVSNDGNSPVMYSGDGLSWTPIASEYILYNINVNSVIGLAMNHDGSVLAICDSSSLFVYRNQILINTIINIYPIVIDMNYDGSVIIVGCFNGYNRYVNVYRDGVLAYTFSEEGGNYGASVAINDDGTVFAVGSPKYEINTTSYVYVYKNGILTYTLNGYRMGYSMAMNSDGSIVIVGTEDAGYVNVYNNGELVYNLTGSGTFGWSLATNSDGTIVAVGTPNDNTVYVYKNGNLLYTFTGTNFFGNSLAMSSDGSIIAVSTRTSGYIYIYNNGNLIKKFLRPGFYTDSGNGVGVRLSYDGSILLNYSPENSPVYAYNINLLNKTNWSSVTYGKGVFVMVANGNNSMYSSDAISWLNGNAPVDSWTSVAYGDGYFVAVSDNGAYPVMYSQDGINWSTTDTGSQINNWGSVASGGSTFLAIPASGATTMTTRVTKTF